MKKFSYLLFFMLILFRAQEGPKVGLVLSGGGAKGFAHIAVLKELENAGVRIDYIGGTSMGAVIGALYAAGYSADELDSMVRKINLNDLIFNNKNRKQLPLFDKTYNEKYVLDIPFDKFKLSLPNAISNSDVPYFTLNQLLIESHDAQDFSQLQIPFYCVATNLETGKEKIFDQGDLALSTMASAALPSILKPVEIEDSLYVDGGLVNNFPAEEMKKRGMDIVIGVELGQSLKTKDELNNVANIMVQVSNFSVKRGVQEQMPYADIILNPNLEEFSTTSFADYEKILKRGYEKATEYSEVFEKIAEKQSFTARQKSPSASAGEYCIIGINIEGYDDFNSDYIKGKLGFNNNEEVSASKITKGMINLAQTDNYESITYRLKSEEGGNNIEIKVQESENKILARLGIHYDNVFRTGVLVNLSSKSFIFNNTSAAMDFVLGDRFRYYLNIFGDNGIKPSIGFRSQYINAPVPIASTQNNFNFINYSYHWAYNTFYIQSTLKDKYSLAFGIDHDYVDIQTNVLPDTHPEQKLLNAFYVSPKGELRADTQDNHNYPKNGLKFYGLAKYTVYSNQDGFLSSLQLSGKANFAFTFQKYFTLQPYAYISIQSNNNSRIFQSVLGGINEQEMLYFEPFVGYKYASLYDYNTILAGMNFQIDLFKNNYLTFQANVANVEPTIEKLRFFKYLHTGVGFSYGYDSPIGPINLSYGYSPQVKKNLVNFSLGYWF